MKKGKKYLEAAKLVDRTKQYTKEEAIKLVKESKKKLDFIIRLTKCSPDENQRIGCDLDTFSIDLNDMYEKRQVNQACFGFFNYTRNTKVDKLKLPGGSGNMLLKYLSKMPMKKIIRYSLCLNCW